MNAARVNTRPWGVSDFMPVACGGVIDLTLVLYIIVYPNISQKLQNVMIYQIYYNRIYTKRQLKTLFLDSKREYWQDRNRSLLYDYLNKEAIP